MSGIKKLFYCLPLKTRLYIRMKAIWLKPREAFKIKSRIKNSYQGYCLGASNEYVLQIISPKIWLKKMNKLALAQPKELEIATEFFDTEITKQREVIIQENKPILICVVKDDLYRIKKFLLHYRSIGVENFAIIDNMSTDGTYEFLMQQADINVFQVAKPYSTNRREAWINRMLAYYGEHHWFIVVDSDELLTYSGLEEHNVNALITYAKHHHRDRLRAMMVDMYPSGNMFEYKNGIDYYEQCCYFDKESYFVGQSDYADVVRGGPRGRVFDEDAYLTKYPVFFLRRGDMEAKSHYLFPYKDNKNVPCELALLHYKFLPGDMEQYKKRAESGMYYNGSQQYKNYIEKIKEYPEITAFNKNSKKYNSSVSLRCISTIENINW